MKKFLKKVEYIWDIYFVYFLYNGNKTQRYYAYLRKKYPEMFTGTNVPPGSSNSGEK
jgi:hypothetical protein